MGEVALFKETEIAKYTVLEFSKHCQERLEQRDLTIEIIKEFFILAKTKIAWIPDYNSDNGMNIRIIGKHPKIGFLTVITAIDLGADGELEIFTAHKITSGRKDYKIWKLGLEKLAQLEEKNVLTK